VCPEVLNWRRLPPDVEVSSSVLRLTEGGPPAWDGWELTAHQNKQLGYLKMFCILLVTLWHSLSNGEWRRVLNLAWKESAYDRFIGKSKPRKKPFALLAAYFVPGSCLAYSLCVCSSMNICLHSLVNLVLHIPEDRHGNETLGSAEGRDSLNSRAIF
jgi:hypothetical protein